MAELIAPFVPVHGSWTFLPDMNWRRQFISGRKVHDP